MDGGNDTRILQEQLANLLRGPQTQLISRITKPENECAPESGGILGDRCSIR
jgi:hypothetical protein